MSAPRRIPPLEQARDVGEVLGRFLLQGTGEALSRGMEILEQRRAENAIAVAGCRHCGGELEAREVEIEGVPTEVSVCVNAVCPSKKGQKTR